MSRVKDQSTRDAIITESQVSVLVEASAGTGKTTLLTDRVVSMVKAGIPLEQLAVVTFNDTAATELSQRIREKLKPKLRTKMDQAWISTMHGFASRILKEYYHLCGGIPAFTMETTHFSRAEMEMQWDIFLAEQPRSILKNSETALRNPGSATLLDIAEKMEKHRWLADASSLGEVETVLNRLTAEWTAELTGLIPFCSDPTDKLFIGISQALKALSEGTPRKIKLNGKQGSWGGKESYQGIRDIIKSYQSDFEQLEGFSKMSPLMDSLDLLVFPFLRKLRNNWESNPARLSFDDLLHNAAQAVEHSKTLRTELQSRFQHIFIDEFQDTSTVQVRLFRGILERAGFKNNLTVVGDPKQSIYGWRSADIETYKTTISDLEKAGALSSRITVNFRSTSSVIRFVNSFGKALFSNIAPGEQPFSCGYSPIEPRPNPGEGLGVFVHSLPTMNAEPMAVVQAEKIADLITDPGSTAVLLRAKTHMDPILAELDKRHIPYTVEASRDFQDREEIKDTAALLRYLLSENDTSHEIFTLRSMYFGIDDRQITEWKMKGKVSEGITSALELLSRLRAVVRELPPDLFIKTLFKNTCILQAIAKSGYQTGRRLSNMGFILETARDTSDYSLLLEILEGKAPQSVDEPSAPPENDFGAVTVTTIHKAKGLAWKHVILANPGGYSSGRIDNVLVNSRTGEAALKIGDGFTLHYLPLKAREQNRAKAEYRRLLYVAVTRPRDRLDIFVPDEARANSPADVLKKALTEPDLYTAVSVEKNESSAEKDRFPAIPTESSGDSFAPVIVPAFPEPEQPVDRAMRLGTEVHRIMEFIDFMNPDAWLKENDAMLKSVLEFPGKARELVLRFFAVFPMKNAEVIGREYPIYTGQNTLYVDLLLERNGILEAVDYKTDTADIPSRVELYKEHQRLYRRELEKTTGKQVKTILVFLHHGSYLEIK